jgi:hypothetical protein
MWACPLQSWPDCGGDAEFRWCHKLIFRQMEGKFLYLLPPGATVKAFDFAIVDILGASDTRSEIEKHEAIISALRHRHSLGVTDLAKVRSLFCCLLQNTLHITNISHIHTNKIGIETNWRRGEAASRAHALLFDHRRHSNIWLHRTQLSD